MGRYVDSKDWKWLVGLITGVMLTGVVTHFNALARLEDDVHDIETMIVERFTRLEMRVDAAAMTAAGINSIGPAVPDTTRGPNG